MKSIHSDDYRHVVEILAATRTARGIQQTAVAAALGKPQSYVSKVEGRERRLDVIEFIAFCRVLGVSPIEILREAKLLRDTD
jgi:transcriptional regulator with XRE-family HTH domain